jgi:Zn-finger protein
MFTAAKKTGSLLLALPVFLFTLAGCGRGETVVPPTLAETKPLTESEDAAGAFLDRHWTRPLAAQGQAPAQFSPLEASLLPADCGSCHPEQYRDWQTSLHAHAMGPGLMGQLLAMDPTARDEHQNCIRCHAPLTEQADGLLAELVAATRSSPRAAPLPAAASLHQQGVVCAACHVRAHQHSGPPRRDGTTPDAAENATLPHAGFVATDAFEDSRFCSACHQFQPDEYALNGKLLENTTEEWKDSRHAREGRSCQSCHMPERRHLWRGIHDPEMVRAAIAFSVESGERANNAIRAALSVRNTGAGHYLPTYVTPRLIAEIEQLDSDGRSLPGTRVERLIQRQVPLDLGSETADTRLPPDGELRLVYERPAHRAAVALAYRLRVEPDEFYARFYRALLADGTAGKGRELIALALKQAESSAFLAFDERR